MTGYPTTSLPACSDGTKRGTRCDCARVSPAVYEIDHSHRSWQHVKKVTSVCVHTCQPDVKKLTLVCHSFICPLTATGRMGTQQLKAHQDCVGGGGAGTSLSVGLCGFFSSPVTPSARLQDRIVNFTLRTVSMSE